MFSPPPGFEDLVSDAEDCPPTGPLLELDVPSVCTLTARKPSPQGAAALAMSASSTIPDVDRAAYLVRFVSDHLGDGELERVYVGMMTESYPADAIELIARAVATWGTARPYTAVVTLAVATGHHWRVIRQKLLMAGIADPFSVRSLHALLDVTEQLIVENISNGRDAEREYRSLNARLYGPDSTGGTPHGFSPDEVEDAFDAFARAAR